MKTIILCGGFGTRLGSETKKTPKPMIKINGKPLVEWIIKIYIKYGFKEFILLTGYKHKVIENYLKKKRFKNNVSVKFIYTGLKTNTGGRVFKIKSLFSKNEDFMLTYGDGISSVNIKNLLKIHKKKSNIATITAVRPPARFGEIHFEKNSYKVKKFSEKPKTNVGWINGGFMVLNSKIFDYFRKKNEILEYHILKRLTLSKKLFAIKHNGIWQCCDTPRDKIQITEIIKKKIIKF
tara:strand:- start:35 stop:742 length:708 start_codon:yes stop_codon:yes gene_type:complete